MNKNEKLDQGVATAPQRVECEPKPWTINRAVVLMLGLRKMKAKLRDYPKVAEEVQCAIDIFIDEALSPVDIRNMEDVRSLPPVFKREGVFELLHRKDNTLTVAFDDPRSWCADSYLMQLDDLTEAQWLGLLGDPSIVTVEDLIAELDRLDPEQVAS